MENQNDLNKNSKKVFESQSLILNFNENVKKFPSQQNIFINQQCIDDVDCQIYKNTIRFTTAIPQVNKKIVYTSVYAYVCMTMLLSYDTKISNSPM